MITERQVWIYREVYNAFHKYIFGMNEKNQQKLINKVLLEFYPEMSVEFYLKLNDVDLRQRLNRLLTDKRLTIETNDNVFIGFDIIRTENSVKSVGDCPQLRCPLRSMDRFEPNLFLSVVPPTDLQPLQNVRLLIKKYQSEKYRITVQ